MAEQTRSTRPRLTACFATAPLETAARQTGFVPRAAKITGKIVLAWVTFGGGVRPTRPSPNWQHT